jgi:PAS domain S-box-containing protein
MVSYQTFFEISNDLFCILDAEGYYKEVNNAFLRLLNYSEDEMRAHPFTFFLHPDDVEATKEEYRKATQGIRNDVIVNRFRDRDGNYHWISWSTIIQCKAGNFYSSGQDVSEHKRLTAALKKEQEERKRRVTRAIIETQETERSKISQELHDNVNQVLTSVKLLMEISQDKPDLTAGTINRAINLQQEAINEIRSLSKRLSAPSLGNLRLSDSIKELINSFPNIDDVKITITYSGIEETEVDQYVHLALYRILQEHLTNITKHAAANTIAVTLDYAEDRLLMEVVDDGVGFDPAKKSGGIGIQNMKTRAESTGGTFELQSAPDEGTTLTVIIPMG